MRFVNFWLVVLSCLAVFGACAEARADSLKVAVVTGGHGFEKAPFLAMFEGHEGVEFEHVDLRDDSEIFEDVAEWPYDGIVLFNMSQRISEERRANFLELLDRGVGLVVLHHAIAAFSQWPEYRKIIGARYYLKDITEDGVTHPRSQYDHDMDFDIHIEDPDHPVTRGVGDFRVHDETYKGFTLAPDNRLLLTTGHPKSQKEVGWARKYGNARVVFIQMGHGPGIYGNEAYRRLVVQAVRWTTKEDSEP